MDAFLKGAPGDAQGAPDEHLNYRRRRHRTRTMIFSHKASTMRKTGVKPDALAAAIAIANGARRRQSRRERLRGIAPIVALAIGIALCIATMAALAAAPTATLWCTVFSDCPEPF